MILEKLNKMNPKKTYINPLGKWKQTRTPDKIGSMWVRGKEGCKRKRGGVRRT